MKKREIKFRFWSTILKHFVVPHDSIYRGAFNDPEFHVMQWTGLKDKNGLEIYEGDLIVIAGKLSDPTEVKWNGFYQGYWRTDWRHKFDYEPDLLVIGNVWENPELIK